ncbi:hypothetical protein [Chryseobacterium oleae]|nr:hypothetical protein [Chryseobacterium oleae]
MEVFIVRHEYGRFEAIDTILGEAHLRQNECSGPDKQYTKP